MERTRQIVSSCAGEWNEWNPQDSFSNDLPRTALLGNGDVGVVSAGQGTEKSYLISKSDFWSCGNLKGVSRGDARDKTKPLPIGGVTVRPFSSSGVSATPGCFYEKLDIWHARLETELEADAGNTLKMRAWMHARENVFILEISASQDMECEIDVWGKADEECFPAKTGEHSWAVSRLTYNGAPENHASWKSEAVLAPRVIQYGKTSAWKEKSPGTISTRLHVLSDQPVWLLVTLGGGGQTYGHDGKLKGADPWGDARQLLERYGSRDGVSALLDSHERWWRRYWEVSSIDLDDSDKDLALIERFYYGAQYLMGAGIRREKIAPGLYGIWHTTDSPNWSSDYHLNYNFIASFYGAASSNRCDMLLPASEAMLAAEAEGERRAASRDELERINRGYVAARPELQHGIKGALLYPVGIGPWGTITDDSYHQELLNVSYSSWPMIQYYEYTRDKEFLARVYGFLKKCARLYEVWLERKEGGELLLVAGYNEGSWAKNPAVELATVRKLMSFLVHASEVLNKDFALRQHWQEILNHLPEQPLAEWKGKLVHALAESEWKGNSWVPLASPVPGDGNIVPLDFILPGGWMGYYSPAVRQEVVRNTIDVFGDGAWGQINNFPRIFYNAVQARYPADKIVASMAGVLKRQMGRNLVVRDGYHGVEKAGATAAINNMLVLSHEGIIKIFPCWSESKDASFSGLRVPEGFVVSSAYDGKRKEVSQLEIVSLFGGSMAVAHPWKQGAVIVKDSSGQCVVSHEGTQPEWKEKMIVLPETKAGEKYCFFRVP